MVSIDWLADTKLAPTEQLPEESGLFRLVDVIVQVHLVPSNLRLGRPHHFSYYGLEGPLLACKANPRSSTLLATR